jgi:hypothetical protein
VPTSRWIQDRQNLVSLFHPQVGLILGGGNTKLQPRWSTFSAGDINLLFHKPGDEEPKFTPPPGIRHTPTNAKLLADNVTMELAYDANKTSVRIELPTSTTARLIYKLDSQPTGTVEAHVPFVPDMFQPWSTAAAKSGTLTSDTLHLTAEETGGAFQHGGWRVSMPPGSYIDWPVLPHNQYRKDGSAEPAEGKIVLTLPLKTPGEQKSVEISILPPDPKPKRKAAAH